MTTMADYDEPVDPHHQVSIALTTFARGPSVYDNEITVGPDEKPPAVPSPRKKSAALASAVPPTKVLSSSILEEKGECSGLPLPPENQNKRASDLRPPDINEKKSKTSHVIPASPRRRSENNTNATALVKKSLSKSPSLPLSELRSPLNASMPQPAAGESQQFDSYSPVELHRERSNSVDMHGYVKCFP